MEVENFMFDWDETLGQTQQVFNDCHQEAQRLIADHLELDPAEVEQKFRNFWREAYGAYHVNPHGLIGLTCQKLTETYGLNKKLAQDVEIALWRTYIQPIALYPDAVTTLDNFRKQGIKMGVVTNAFEKWDRKKRHWTRFDQYMVYHQSVVVPPNEAKDEYWWTKAAHYYGFRKDRTAVVGDSWESDVEPAIGAEFAKIYHVVRQVGHWFVKDGEDHPQVVTINSLLEMQELRPEG
ncbi:MAG: HAD family hydrolase [bacterium]|nr:HAD family hydrolase [bacterium]